MQRKIFTVIALTNIALAVMLCATSQAQVQDAKSPYPTMAPLDQYLIPDRNAEIALARTAAPDSISRDAEVMVLGRRGYESAVKGKNGFVCLVWRSWAEQADVFLPRWFPRTRRPAQSRNLSSIPLISGCASQVLPLCPHSVSSQHSSL